MPADLSKIPEPYRGLIQEFIDLFPDDLPAGLPPKRPGMVSELVIPFKEGSIPVTSYRIR